jgi:protein involved in polysaccharide export with SLBB domain
MADSDFNTVKPVEGLQNVQGLTPTERRQERRRRQNDQAKHHEESGEKHDEVEDNTTFDDGQDHMIDYCA